jgi:hypothetical protein
LAVVLFGLAWFAILLAVAYYTSGNPYQWQVLLAVVMAMIIAGLRFVPIEDDESDHI